jgi:hypothetical protein
MPTEQVGAAFAAFGACKRLSNPETNCASSADAALRVEFGGGRIGDTTGNYSAPYFPGACWNRSSARRLKDIA